MANDEKSTTRRPDVVGLSEAHLALAQQLAHIGSWELDLINLHNMDGNPLRWSDETFRLLGYTPRGVEPSNEIFFESVHPEDREKIRRAVARAIEEQIPYNIEHRVVWPNGTERILHEQSTIVYDDDGRPVKMLGVVQDITLRKEREAHLELQAMILRNVADSIIVTDAKGNITYWNSGSQAIFGYSEDEMLGRSLVKLYATRRTALAQTEVRSILKGRDFSGEWEGLRKDARAVWLNMRFTGLRDANNKAVGMLAVGKDITRQRRELETMRHSETLYRAVGESIDYGVWTCDALGRLTHMSESFMKLLGLTPAQNLGDGWVNALHPEEREGIMTSWRECLRVGGIWNCRYQILGADGAYHPVLTHAAPVRNKKNKVLCWAGLNLDLTLLK